MDEMSVVTLDGPSGVGKSTVSRMVASATGYIYLDTGAMYRAAGLYLKECGVDLEDETAVRKTLENIAIKFHPLPDADGDVGVLLNGRDVSEAIRTPEMAMVASKVSAIPAVREILTRKQQEYGIRGKVVAEGRDTGTVVFPGAAYKFYLDAEVEERARRRLIQYRQQGLDSDYEKTLELIKKRDKDDSERAVAPLRMADDAVRIDTTSMKPEEVVSKILAVIAEKQKKRG